MAHRWKHFPGAAGGCISVATYLAISSQVCFASEAHLIPSSVCTSSHSVVSRTKSASSVRSRRWCVCSEVRGSRNASWGSRGSSRLTRGELVRPAHGLGDELLLATGDAVFSANLANGAFAAFLLGVPGVRFGMLEMAKFRQLAPPLPRASPDHAQVPAEREADADRERRGVPVAASAAPLAVCECEPARSDGPQRAVRLDRTLLVGDGAAERHRIRPGPGDLAVALDATCPEGCCAGTCDACYIPSTGAALCRRRAHLTHHRQRRPPCTAVGAGRDERMGARGARRHPPGTRGAWVSLCDASAKAHAPHRSIARHRECPHSAQEAERQAARARPLSTCAASLVHCSQSGLRRVRSCSRP